MRRVFFFTYIAVAVAALVSLSIPIFERFWHASDTELPFNDQVFNISPVFAVGLLIVLAVKWWAHEPEDQGENRPDRTMGSLMGWPVSVITGIAVGIFASQSVEAAMCTHVWQIYC